MKVEHKSSYQPLFRLFIKHTCSHITNISLLNPKIGYNLRRFWSGSLLTFKGNTYGEDKNKTFP